MWPARSYIQLADDGGGEEQEDDSEAVFVRVRRYLTDRSADVDDLFGIRRSQLDVSDTRLGSGQFGYVCRATYRIDGEPPVTVAVKTLKRSRQPAKQVSRDRKSARVIRHPSSC